MITGKNWRVHAEWKKLCYTSPAMYALVAAAAEFARQEYGENTVITSVFRDQEGSTHKCLRAVDVRVFNPARNVVNAERGWKHADDIVAWINKTFAYEGEHLCAVRHGEGLHDHVHLQIGNSTRYGGWA